MAIVTTSRPSHVVAIESAWFPNEIRTELNARVEDADVFDDDDTEVQYRVRLSRPVHVLERRCRTPNDTEEWTSVVSFDALVPAVECLSALLRQTRVQTVELVSGSAFLGRYDLTTERGRLCGILDAVVV